MNKLFVRALVRDTLNGCVSFTRNSLILLGSLVLFLGMIVVYRPEVTGRVQAFFAAPMPATVPMAFLTGMPNNASGHDYSFGQARVRDERGIADDEERGTSTPRAAVVTKTAGSIGSPNEQAGITRYLARKYRVSADAVDLMVSAAYLIGRDEGLDPKLILAVVAIESGFNPFAESVGGAQGLMQVMSKVHEQKLDSMGGAREALNPVSNIRVGATILKDCIRRGGTIKDGLRLYVGAGMADDGGYGAKVLQEKDRIEFAARGGNPAVFAPAAAKAPAVQASAAASLADGFKRSDEALPGAKDTVASL